MSSIRNQLEVEGYLLLPTYVLNNNRQTLHSKAEIIFILLLLQCTMCSHKPQNSYAVIIASQTAPPTGDAKSAMPQSSLFDTPYSPS